MTTLITRFEQTRPKQALLRIEGSLLSIDAQTIEHLCLELCRRGIRITINLSRVGFLTEGAADILCRLRQRCGVVLERMHLVAQEIIEVSEMSSKEVSI